MSGPRPKPLAPMAPLAVEKSQTGSLPKKVYLAPQPLGSCIVTMPVAEGLETKNIFVINPDEKKSAQQLVKLLVPGNVQAICTDPQQQIVVGANLGRVCAWRKDKTELQKITDATFLTAEEKATHHVKKIKNMTFCQQTDFICGVLTTQSSDKTATDKLFIFNLRNKTKEIFPLPESTKITQVRHFYRNDMHKLLIALGNGDLITFDIDFASKKLANRQLLLKGNDSAISDCVVSLKGDFIATEGFYRNERLACVWQFEADGSLKQEPSFSMPITSSTELQSLADHSLILRDHHQRPVLVDCRNLVSKRLSEQAVQHLCRLDGDRIALFNADSSYTILPSQQREIYQNVLNTLNSTLVMHKGETKEEKNQFDFKLFQAPSDHSVVDETSIRNALNFIMKNSTRNLPSHHQDRIAIEIFCGKNADPKKSIHDCINETISQVTHNRAIHMSEGLYELLHILSEKFEVKPGVKTARRAAL